MSYLRLVLFCCPFLLLSCSKQPSAVIKEKTHTILEAINEGEYNVVNEMYTSIDHTSLGFMGAARDIYDDIKRLIQKYGVPDENEIVVSKVDYPNGSLDQDKHIVLYASTSKFEDTQVDMLFGEKDGDLELVHMKISGREF